MNTQHTPGPWNVSQPCELSPRYSVYHNGPLVYCDRGEDAHLIAAAPDLLAALQKIDANAAESVEWIRRVAREALAKATGAA